MSWAGVVRRTGNWWFLSLALRILMLLYDIASVAIVCDSTMYTILFLLSMYLPFPDYIL